MAGQEQAKKLDRPAVVAFRTTHLVKGELLRLAKRRRETLSIFMEEEIVKPFLRKLNNGEGL